MYDQSEVLRPQPSIEPQTLTDGTVNGADVDTKQFGSATVVIDVGLWTDGSSVFSVEEANDDGTGDLCGLDPDKQPVHLDCHRHECTLRARPDEVVAGLMDKPPSSANR